MAKGKKQRRGRGEGSIHQRKADGLWVVVLELGFNPETKKRRRKVAYCQTKQEAQAKLLELQQRKAAGTVDPSLKLKDKMDWWLECTVKPPTDPDAGPRGKKAR
jgi:hypothetical protein